MRKIYEIVIISIIFFIICFIYKGQHKVTLHEGKGWDGAFYYQMTEQIQHGAYPVTGVLPYIKRLGTPFLIAYYSKYTGINILDSALHVNLTGAFITVILLLLWLRLFIKEFWVRGLLCFLFMMVWYVLVRFSFYSPMASDAWGAPWFVGGLLLLEAIRKSYYNKSNSAFAGYVIIFSFVTAIGNMFRESNAVLCVLPFFILNPLKNLNITSDKLNLSHGVTLFRDKLKLYFNRQTSLLFIPVIFIFFSNVLISRCISPIDPGAYSYLLTAVSWLYTKSLAEYLLGIFIAYGPLILLVPYFYKQYKSLLWERQELLILVILSFLLGFIGGTDTERITFMTGFPVILVLMGISIRGIFNSSQRWWLYILFILQSISYRFFWNLPDYPVEKIHTPFPVFGFMSSHFQYMNLYSHFGDFKVQVILLLEYIILLFATGYILYNKVVFKIRRRSYHL